MPLINEKMMTGFPGCNLKQFDSHHFKDYHTAMYQAISATPQGIIELLPNLAVHYEKTIVFFPDLSLLVSTFSLLSSENFTFLAPLDHWLPERLEPRNNRILTVLEIELNV